MLGSLLPLSQGCLQHGHSPHVCPGGANLGLERSVLGKRTLQPCDTKCLRGIMFLGQIGEVHTFFQKIQADVLCCPVPTWLLTLPWAFAQSSHLLFHLSSPEPWPQVWPPLLSKFLLTYTFFCPDTPLTWTILCCQLFPANLTAASNSAEQSPSTQPAFLLFGFIIPKLWKSVCSEKANADTGVQPTFAV